jgi:murein DD-endopeptidase MepM/ murein hydrolase activator NlpD
MGNCIRIDHGNDTGSIYASLDQIRVKVGDVVNQNTVIGTVGGTLCENCKRFGSTASALHFSILYKGNFVAPGWGSPTADSYFGTRLNQYKGGKKL